MFGTIKIRPGNLIYIGPNVKVDKQNNQGTSNNKSPKGGG